MKNKDKNKQKKKLDRKFVRINPDRDSFNISKAQNKIFRHIKKSYKERNEKSTKNKIVEDVEKMTKMVKQLCV